MKITATATLLAVTLAAGAHAQDVADTGGTADYDDTYTSANKPSISIGAGVAFMPDYSGADTYQSFAIPALAVYKEITPGNLAYIKGLTAGVDHAVNDQLSIGAMADYRYKRDSSDSSRLAGMDDIDAAIEFGPKVRYQLTPRVGLEGTALFDVSDASNGYTVRTGADYSVPLSPVTLLTIAGGLNYGSSNFNNTYYGVTQADARPGRGAYRPGSGLTNFDSSVTVKQAVTRHWSVQGKLGADLLLADVADSTIVDQAFQPSLTIGAAYTF